MHTLKAIKVGISRAMMLGGAACAASAFAPLMAEAQGTPAAKDTIETVVVTATRREVSLTEAPVAVSAFRGSDLQSRHLNDIEDLSTLVPNFQYGSSYGAARATIRGIGTNDLTGGADPGVAYHLDGVYIGNTGPAANSFFDVERIEVLRGPQGTLFGRNATGGSVNLIPNRPTREATGYAHMTVGADPFMYSAEGAVSGPLSATGDLSGRLSVMRTYNEGYAKNLSQNGPERLDDDDSIGLRGQLLFEPSDGVMIHASVNYQEIDASGPGYQLLGRGGTSGLPTTAELFGGKGAPLDERDVYANFGEAEGEFLLGTIDSAIDVGAGTLKVLLSAGKVDSKVMADGDITDIELVHYDIRYDAEQQFGEVTYEFSPADGLDLIIGANAYHQESEQPFEVPISILFGPAPVSIILNGDLENTSYAAFAHADYSVSDRVKLFGGVRRTSDEKKYTSSNNFVGATSGDPSWKETTYEAGISVTVTDGVTAYAKYSTGFKGGGVQIGDLSPPADPETNSSTEAGLKGMFLDNTLEANLAIFHMPYDDLQLTKVSGLVPAYQNAAKATVDGAELEVQWMLVDAFRVEFSGAILDAEFDEFTTANPADPVPVDLDLSGNKLPNTSKSAFSVGGYYSVEDFAWGELTVGARYYWQSKQYLDAFNVPNLSQDSVGRWDLSMSLDSRDGVWSGSLFAKNLTDELVRTTGFVASAILGAPAYGTLAPGRSVGISVRRNF